MSRKVAEKLFGRVIDRKIHAAGNFKPDLEGMRKDFEYAKAVSMLFCVCCGTIYELPVEQVKRILIEYDLSLPGHNFFLQTKGSECEVCASTENGAEIILLDLN